MGSGLGADFFGRAVSTLAAVRACTLLGVFFLANFTEFLLRRARGNLFCSADQWRTAPRLCSLDICRNSRPRRAHDDTRRSWHADAVFSSSCSWPNVFLVWVTVGPA